MGQFSGNWVDLVIVLVLFYYVSDSWRHGFLLILSDFLAFLGSLILSLRIFKFASEVLVNSFSLSISYANALGFIVTAVVLERILSFLFHTLIKKLPKKVKKNKWNKYLGAIPAFGEGLVLMAFLLTAVMALPVLPQIKRDVSESRIGGLIINQTSGLERAVNEVFGGAINDTLTSLTIKTGSRERIDLPSDIKQNLSVDEASEKQMFELVNAERGKNGISPLTWAPEIVPVSRAHARDMWERYYFSHYSPEGEDVGGRLDTAQVGYRFAGENLALAPTVQTAHTGLMNSEGHRANILEPKFKKIGIGVIDNGVYGKMFVQVFTD